MNEEEKKAIEDMNRFANGIDMSCVTARQMQIILNLVEKLQKENKELKEDRDKFKKELLKRITYCNELEKDLFENGSNYVIPKQKVKDKIADKIAEIEADKLNYIEDDWYLESELKGYAIDKLKELLESEE